jgi:hypothetical protein
MSGPRAAAAVALAIAAADAWLLLRSGLGIGDLLAFALTAAAGLGAGRALLVVSGFEARDGVSEGVASLACGSALHLAVAFVLFHYDLRTALGVADQQAAAGLVLGLVAVTGLWRRHAIPADRPFSREPWTAAALLAVASLVALLTAFGWFDGRLGEENRVSTRWRAGQGLASFAPPVEWGSGLDRHAHVFGRLAARGFPYSFPKGQFQHDGVHTEVVALVLLGGPYSEARAMAGSKPLSLQWLALVAFGTFLLARDVAGASSRAAGLAGAGSLLFAAVHPALFGGHGATSFALAPISSVLYHNLTQQASLALGLGGLYVAALALRDAGPRWPFPLGCAVVAVSIFHKPSFFTVAAPALVLAALRAGAGAGLLPRATGIGVLMAGAAGWAAYPRMLGTRTALGVSVELSPFSWPLHKDLGLPWPTTGRVAAIASVLLLSYAVLVPVAVELIRRASWRKALRSLREPGRLALALAAAFGVASGHLLAETGGYASQGRFMYGYAAGYTCALPLLLRALETLPPGPLRRGGWALLALHLVSGLLNLWAFAWDGAT